MGDDEYIYVCEELLFPIISEFNPDLILISAGFDSSLNDPLGGMRITPEGYAYITTRLMEIQPKVIAVLEGGYATTNIAVCGEATIRALNGEELPFKSIPGC